MPVRRLSGKDCHKQLTQPAAKRQTRTAKAAETQRSESSSEEVGLSVSEQLSELASQEYIEPQESLSEKLSTSEESQEDYDTKESEEMLKDTEQDDTDKQVEEIRNLCCCIGIDNLADFHNALVMLFGEEAGKDRYQKIKSDPEINAYWKDVPVHSQEEKFDIYCRLVFAESDIPREEVPDDFASFLWKSNAKRKNLNSLRAALQNHYGKERGMKYYSLFKSHIKIMNRM
jgi:hypothetical protein